MEWRTLKKNVQRIAAGTRAHPVFENWRSGLDDSRISQSKEQTSRSMPPLVASALCFSHERFSCSPRSASRGPYTAFLRDLERGTRKAERGSQVDRDARVQLNGRLASLFLVDGGINGHAIPGELERCSPLPSLTIRQHGDMPVYRYLFGFYRANHSG